ncbi:nucleotidyltransferase family protein [Neiella marina]|uniref:Nucleotidyltransferase family protein n=1 Tax=Neiella holothuriorum TaxID=2870530 RepID=A0ABS7EH46_9GAMM|nr:nucleotidyltransferase family protein [Neiella holothuriorum]MBW8191650.1 nucleotidyltransferase family protein [Neiella holothuriorum]
MRLFQLLSSPDKSLNLSLFKWSTLLAEARYMSMLGQLKPLLVKAHVWHKLPLKVQQTIESDFCVYANQRRLLSQESERLSSLLKGLNVDHVYLKGAAYQLAGYPEFDGRLMADIDLLVSRDSLPKVEAELLKSGWIFTKTNDYDEKFYREWSHEIPPLRHIERGTELDVHFNIMPVILKNSPSPALLQSKITPLPQLPSAYMLEPSALAFHSIIHLFFESEYNKGIRDLNDIYMLTKHFDGVDFWQGLIALEGEMGNGDCIYWALYFLRKIYSLSPPTYVLEHFDKCAPNKALAAILGWSFTQVFYQQYPPYRSKLHLVAAAILYWRGHLKRMPLYKLIPHLFVKGWRQFINKEEMTLEDVFRVR